METKISNSLNKPLICLPSCVFLLTLVQLLRIAFNRIIFSFTGHTVFRHTLAGMFFMLLMTAVMLILFFPKIKSALMPQKFSVIYIIITVSAVIFAGSSCFFINQVSVQSLITLMYNAFVTPVFEEILFRAVIWRILEKGKVKFVWLTDALLFGLWHIGYADTVIFRTSLFNPQADIFNIMLWKVITGFAIGLVLSFLRKKSGNAYISLIIHILINFVGS